MNRYTSNLRDPDRTLAMLKKYSIACADGNRVGVTDVDMDRSIL